MAESQKRSVREWLQFAVAAGTSLVLAIGWVVRVDTRVGVCERFIQQHDLEREAIVQRWDREYHILERRIGELSAELHEHLAEFKTERRLRQMGMGGMPGPGTGLNPTGKAHE